MSNVIIGNARTLTTPEPHTLRLVGSSPVEADAEGRWVIPGLWDQHVHMGQWAMALRRPTLADARSAAEVAARCRDLLSRAEPLIASGFDDVCWPDFPTTALLDEACGAHPVVVISADLHRCWANSAALQRYGMSYSDTPLCEEEAFQLQMRVAEVPTSTLDAWVHEAAKAAARRGIVGITDMERQWGRSVWSRRMDEGFDIVRVRSAIWPEDLGQAISTGLHTGDVDLQHPLLQVGPFKLIADGSMGSRTAFCHEPYPDGTRGVLSFDEATICSSIARAWNAGLHPAIHAIGDATNQIVLNAFANASVHGSIEHAQLLTDSDVRRFAELGVTASVQPEHLVRGAQIAHDVWAGRTNRVYRLRELLDAGAQLQFGSDAPVVALDPWQQIQAAVERSLPGNEPCHPEQRLTFAEALAASTDNRGIAPVNGGPADLVFLDVDPRTLHGHGLRDMPVAATMVDGRFTYDAR